MPQSRASAIVESKFQKVQNDLISAEIPDWSRENPQRFWDPSRRLLRSIRRYQQLAKKPGRFAAIMRRRWVFSHRFWSAVTGADIPINCGLEGGLLLPHPNGIVIDPKAAIGPNCLIFQQVTIGTISSEIGHPVLEGHVDVGAGAKIFGPVRIGRHAKIGANAVVLCDVPEGATAVGVPARVVPKSRPSDILSSKSCT